MAEKTFPSEADNAKQRWNPSANLPAVLGRNIASSLRRWSCEANVGLGCPSRISRAFTMLKGSGSRTHTGSRAAWGSRLCPQPCDIVVAVRDHGTHAIPCGPPTLVSVSVSGSRVPIAPQAGFLTYPTEALPLTELRPPPTEVLPLTEQVHTWQDSAVLPV